MFYEELLTHFVEMSKYIFGDNLLGIYLHGSLAMGCFNPQKSDLDLILVVKNNISHARKIEFLKNVVKFNEEAPQKGIELSIVKREFCNPFVYPTPYELHFSNTYVDWVKEKPEDYIEKIIGTDKDLAAHFTIINKFGIALYGAPISEIFGKVPKSSYVDSIWYDIENAREDILSNPMYVTLNLCRVLAYLKDELVLSKKTGGEWGISHLPDEYIPFVNHALHCYLNDETMKVDSKDKSDVAIGFADYMLMQIREEITLQNIDLKI